MAFIPRTDWSFLRQKYLGEAPSTGGAGAASEGGTGTAPSGGSAAPPPAGTGRFAALRGFFEANQPTANAQASEIARGVEQQAQGAQAKATEAGDTPLNFGGLELSGQAESDRQSALDAVNASQSQSGIEGLIGQRGADYTPGMRSSDAYLYGRSGAMQGLSPWADTLSSLTTTPREALSAPDWTEYNSRSLPEWNQPSDPAGPPPHRPYFGDSAEYGRLRGQQDEYDYWNSRYREQQAGQQKRSRRGG